MVVLTRDGVLAMRRSEVEILNILKFLWDDEGIERFTTVSQARISMSDGS